MFKKLCILLIFSKLKCNTDNVVVKEDGTEIKQT